MYRQDEVAQLHRLAEHLVLVQPAQFDLHASAGQLPDF